MRQKSLLINLIGISLLTGVMIPQAGMAAITTAFASASVVETATLTQLKSILAEDAFGSAIVLDQPQTAPTKTSINLLFELDTARSVATYIMSNTSNATYSFSVPAPANSTSVVRADGTGKQVVSSLSDLAYTLGVPSSSITIVSKLNRDTSGSNGPTAGNYYISIDYN